MPVSHRFRLPAHIFSKFVHAKKRSRFENRLLEEGATQNQLTVTATVVVCAATVLPDAGVAVTVTE